VPTKEQLEQEIKRRGLRVDSRRAATRTERAPATPTSAPARPDAPSGELAGLAQALTGSGTDQPEFYGSIGESAEESFDTFRKNLPKAAMVAASIAPVGRVVATALPAATRAALARGAARVGGSAANAATAARGAAGSAEAQVQAALARSMAPPRPSLFRRALGGGREVTGNAAAGVVGQGLSGDIDELSDIPGAAARGAVGGVISGSAAKKIARLGLSKEQMDALKNLTMNTPIGRMGISQLAKKLGVSSTKAATIWYAMHPVSRRGLSRAAAAFTGAQD